jgi:hypothetical protein
MKRILAAAAVILLALSGCGASAYQMGQAVEFAGRTWYVLADSPAGQNYVTLLSEQIVVPDSVYFDDDLLYLPVRHFQDAKLSYDESAISLYLTEEVMPELGADHLVVVDGYAIRLLNMDDLQNVLDLRAVKDDNGLTYYVQASSGDYDWLVPRGGWYWTMIECTDDVGNIVYGEAGSQQYLHYCWYILTNYGAVVLTSVGNQTDDGIKIVVNAKKTAVSAAD